MSQYFQMSLAEVANIATGNGKPLDFEKLRDLNNKVYPFAKAYKAGHYDGGWGNNLSPFAYQAWKPNSSLPKDDKFVTESVGYSYARRNTVHAFLNKRQIANIQKATRNGGKVEMLDIKEDLSDFKKRDAASFKCEIVSMYNVKERIDYEDYVIQTGICRMHHDSFGYKRNCYIEEVYVIRKNRYFTICNRYALQQLSGRMKNTQHKDMLAKGACVDFDENESEFSRHYNFNNLTNTIISRNKIVADGIYRAVKYNELPEFFGLGRTKRSKATMPLSGKKKKEGERLFFELVVNDLSNDERDEKLTRFVNLGRC